eukprot:TRINITY_DN3380_c0_g1_i1.p1 TRINITY_DN3380_c0_g1~~TRINITY_DN3380_c0_g1_i1.p1  ORF type:complete len:223 (+),score=0.90 TRINITY_DN3380_c0_g1_i1:78-746(+)
MSTKVRSTTASGSVVYESERAVDEYLQFHYETPDKIWKFSEISAPGTDFMPKCAEICAKFANLEGESRALDLGCAVGRASFELSKGFSEVVGIDFSAAFISAAQAIQKSQKSDYSALISGEIREKRTVFAPKNANSDRISFEIGDACELNCEKLGEFDAILAANLLCRLPHPMKFLESVPKLLKKRRNFGPCFAVFLARRIYRSERMDWRKNGRKWRNRRFL